MSYWLIVAGLALVLVAGVHSWIGERNVVGPLLAAAGTSGTVDPKLALRRRVFRGAWHTTSVTWFANGLLLLALAVSSLDAGAMRAAGVLAALFGGIGVYLLVKYRGRHRGAPFFLVASACATAAIIDA